MDITLERVERLREKANVSYAQAKEALEYSGGDLLDALIYLEEQGTIPRPEGGCYSTRGEKPSAEQQPEETEKEEEAPFLLRVRRWLLDNELEVWRRDKPLTAMPVLVLILLVLLAAWAVLPLLIIGLFLGFRYRFSGPDLDRDSINEAMGTVADTASDLGQQVMDELRRQHDKNQDKGNVDRDTGDNNDIEK